MSGSARSRFSPKGRKVSPTGRSAGPSLHSREKGPAPLRHPKMPADRKADPQPVVARRHHVAPDIRREQIVQAALGLFAEKGFARTTTRDIANAAGIAEGTIYNHFASKEELLLAFVKSAALDTLGDLFDRLETLDDLTAVTAIIRNRLEIWDERLPMMKVVISEAFFQPDLAQQLRDELFQPVMQLMNGFFRRRVLHGGFRSFDTLLGMQGMLGMAFFGFVGNRFFYDEKHRRSLDALAKELADLFLYGMAKQPLRAVEVSGARKARARVVPKGTKAKSGVSTSGGRK